MRKRVKRDTITPLIDIQIEVRVFYEFKSIKMSDYQCHLFRINKFDIENEYKTVLASSLSLLFKNCDLI